MAILQVGHGGFVLSTTVFRQSCDCPPSVPLQRLLGVSEFVQSCLSVVELLATVPASAELQETIDGGSDSQEDLPPVLGVQRRHVWNPDLAGFAAAASFAAFSCFECFTRGRAGVRWQCRSMGIRRGGLPGLDFYECQTVITPSQS